MKTSLLTLGLGLLLLTSNAAFARQDVLRYEPSSEHPFGRPNPDAPPEISQFAFMIGENDCINSRRQPGSDTWVESTRTWDAKYTLNGYGIIDSGRSGTTTNGNVRIYDTASKQWQVTFFAMPAYSSGVWSGGMVGDDIVLKQAQVAPGNNIPGHSTLTFSNISMDGFDWRGEWISEDGSIVYPFWKVSCKKRKPSH